MYTCTICYSLNHNARLHCQNCGAVPAKYSLTSKPYDNLQFVPIVAAHGCDRIEHHHTTKANLRTVTLDYYAEAPIKS